MVKAQLQKALAGTDLNSTLTEGNAGSGARSGDRGADSGNNGSDVRSDSDSSSGKVLGEEFRLEKLKSERLEDWTRISDRDKQKPGAVDSGQALTPAEEAIPPLPPLGITTTKTTTPPTTTDPLHVVASKTPPLLPAVDDNVVGAGVAEETTDVSPPAAGSTRQGQRRQVGRPQSSKGGCCAGQPKTSH